MADREKPVGRLIDANALGEVLEDLQNRYNKAGFVLSAKAIENARKIVAAMKTVEAEPVRHGRWFDTGVENETGNIYFCSVCNKYNNPNKKDAEMKRAKEKPAYCPNCGAKMNK